NTLTGGAGNDVLDGGAGADTLTGGTGDDIYIRDNVNDVLNENTNAGTDTVRSSVAYTLGVNVENLTLSGTSAINGTGNAANNMMAGNSANNVLTGLGGNDTYLYSRGGGQDTVIDNSGASDTMLFGATINPQDLILSRQANDLRLSVYGTGDQVTMQNWYLGVSYQTEVIQAGNGEQLMNTQVNQLIQAMAGFTQQTGLSWDQAVAQRPQDVQQILAANWQ
ncbi:MAG: Ig family protein, partial [Nitrospirota bacterium]|nr:Ig family protein [Nitrospirota bacterium]